VEYLWDQGILAEFPEEWAPLLFLDPNDPRLPDWLPQEVSGHPLNQSQRAAWFDELLKRYGDLSSELDRNEDSNTRMLVLLTSLYQMHLDRNIGTLPSPSFLVVEQWSQSPTRAPKKP
jgi:hypothetical protein